ncbi:ribosome biogenesis GTP-binding protein YihA/YsxC [Desulfovibrio sp. OttesenSCG-928-O18]|nr:ribosome biogenesis GTP-binding protein YihA/YsxC [Desulfovibrio sp. OttesenSCG-928-O18]
MNPTLILETTAYTLDQLQRDETPQLALAGRSNVGKSSLINALAGRKQLAKTSATPGKTRSVNYYRVQPDNFFLVDLPGYGYARCSKTEQERWAALIEKYLVSAKALHGLVLLLDCRLPPQKPDLALLSFAMANGIALIPILTKADKCTQAEQQKRQKEWTALLPKAPIITSSVKRSGLDALWQAMREMAAG